MLPGIATIFYFLEIWKRTDCYHCLSPNGHNPLVFLFPSYHELRNTPEVFVLNRQIYHEQRPKESDMLIKFTATARNRNALSNCRHKNIDRDVFAHNTWVTKTCFDVFISISFYFMMKHIICVSFVWAKQRIIRTFFDTDFCLGRKAAFNVIVRDY